MCEFYIGWLYDDDIMSKNKEAVYMYKYLYFFLILFLPFTLFSKQLDWSHDYVQTLKEAKKEHKDIYLFIGADVCKFCDKFKATTLSDKATLKRLKESYKVIYLSRDRHLIPSHFEKKGVPRHYFLTPNGKIFYQDWGGREVDGFNLMLDEAELSRN